MADGKKKKRAKKALRRHQKEKEITRQVRGSENRTDVEAEIESEEPTEMGGGVSSFEDEGGREVIVTLVERREPAATSVSGERDAESRVDVLASRKDAASSDSTIKREAKRTWSPRPLEASSTLRSPAPSMAGQADQS